MTIARKVVTDWAIRMAYSTIDRTKLVTAASELGRNTLVHGMGGTMTIRELNVAGRVGLELVFEDQGPGIANQELALTDGFSTARSLGLGLGGARRLVNEFELVSSAGAGCKVTIKKWKRP